MKNDLQKDEIKISVASPDDAAELLEILAYYVRETAIPYDNEVPTIDRFRQRIENTLEKYPFLEARRGGGGILGYVHASEFSERPGYEGSVKTSIFVRSDARYGGIGRQLYEALEDALKLQHIYDLNACISYCDDEWERLPKTSPRFHEKMGYRLVWRFPEDRHKFGRPVDMLLMKKRIGKPDPSQPVLPFPAVREEFEKNLS